MSMNVSIQSNTISQVYNAENMSLILGPAKLQNEEEQSKLIAELRRQLEQQTAALPEETRAEILSHAEQAATPTQDSKKRESSVLAFLDLLKSSLGDTASIVLTAVKLARVIGGL